MITNDEKLSDEFEKTLLITLDFLPNRGGVSNYYYNIYKNLPENKILILTNINGDQLKNVIRKNLNFGLIHFFKTLSEIIKIIKKEKIQKIWIGNILPLGKFAYIIKKLLKIDYCIFIHGLDIKLAQNHIIKKIFTKKILNSAECIFANSNSTAGVIKTKTEIKIIYPGIDSNFTNINQDIKSEIINKYALENKKIILTAGRIVQRKNHALVIEATNQLLNEFNDLIYLIAGSGENLQNLKTLASENKNIIFLGEISDEELKCLYSICDIFVMTSKETNNDTEGFGIVYLEAGIFKKPVIASNSGGAKEAIINNQTGILINQNSKEELIDAIKKLLNDKELSKNLGQNSYNRIIEKFLWKNITKDLIKQIHD